MARLFQEEYINLNVSTESTMIAVQARDDMWITEGLKLMQSAIDHIKKENITSSRSFFYSKEGLDFNKKLSTLIKNRFGITVDLVLVQNFNAFVYPLHMPGPNVLLRYTLKEKMDYVKENKNSNNTLAKLYTYQKELLKDMSLRNIKIDINKGYVTGLSKDSKFIVGCNFVAFVQELDANAKQLLGVLTHEIGHAFTHLSVSQRDYVNTTVLLNTFLENVDKKGKSPKESFLLAYSRVTGKDLSKLKVLDDKKLATTLLESVGQLTTNNYNTIDSEQQADQFAGRFGLAAETMVLLNKMGSYNIFEQFKFSVMFTFINVYFIMLQCFLDGKVFVITLRDILNILWECYLISGTMYVCKVPLVDQEVLFNSVYDSNKFRASRVRSECLRQLKGLDDPELQKALLEDIEKIEKLPEYNLPHIFTNMPGEMIWDMVYSLLAMVCPVSWFFYTGVKVVAGSMLTAIIPYFRRKSQMRDIDRYIELLDANDLHKASARLNIHNKS